MDWHLGGLFVSAFVSATVLPGNSEIVLAAVLNAGASAPLAVLVATVGNTLGGMTTWLLGCLIPSRVPDGPVLARTRRYGPAILLLSWVPIVGDAFCAAAGWLRMHWLPCAAAMALGKLARYLLVAQAVALAA